MTGEDEARWRREEERERLTERISSHDGVPSREEHLVEASSSQDSASLIDLIPGRKLLREGLIGTFVLGTVVFLIVGNEGNWLRAVLISPLVSGSLAFLFVFLVWLWFLIGAYRGPMRGTMMASIAVIQEAMNRGTGVVSGATEGGRQRRGGVGGS